MNERPLASPVTVDPVTGVLIFEGHPLTLDLRTGIAQVRLGNVTFAARPMLWREKVALARYVGLGPAFLRHQIFSLCLAPGTLLPKNGAELKSLLEFVLWVQQPLSGQSVPLDVEALAAATLGVCHALGVRPADLADRQAPEVEDLWQAIQAKSSEYPAPEPTDKQGIGRVSGMADPPKPKPTPSAARAVMPAAKASTPASSMARPKVAARSYPWAEGSPKARENASPVDRMSPGAAPGSARLPRQLAYPSSPAVNAVHRPRPVMRQLAPPPMTRTPPEPLAPDRANAQRPPAGVELAFTEPIKLRATPLSQPPKTPARKTRSFVAPRKATTRAVSSEIPRPAIAMPTLPDAPLEPAWNLPDEEELRSLFDEWDRRLSETIDRLGLDEER